MPVRNVFGSSAPNLGKNDRLTIPFEGGMHSFKRQAACVKGKAPPLIPSADVVQTNSLIVLMFVESQSVHI
jgi:hypothetical protein